MGSDSWVWVWRVSSSLSMWMVVVVVCAVDLEAMDRAHRIGQTRPVFAVRLIARDTVEEKVLELQARKRDLADAIVRADDGLVASLTREELELLLG